MKTSVTRLVAVSVLLAGCQNLDMRSAWLRKTDQFGQNNGQIPAGQQNSSLPSADNSSLHANNENPLSSNSSNAVATSLSAPSQTNSVQALLKLGHREAQQGQFDAAKRYYQRVLQLQSNNSTAHHRLAIIADNQQDYQSAENHYKQALQTSPNNADLHSDLGYSYYLQERFDESERYLEKALTLQPSQKKASNNLGRLYSKLGDYDRAAAAFRRFGTEAEVQDEMARLFPQGRPNGRIPQGAPGIPNNLTLNMKRMMERERQLDMAARQPQMAQFTQHPEAPGQIRHPYSNAPFAGNPGMNFAATQAMASGQFPSQSVPDYQINRAFAEIDNGGNPSGFGSHIDNRITRTSGTEYYQPGVAGQFPSPAQSSQRVHTPQNPLDQMPMWPPQPSQHHSQTSAQSTLQPGLPQISPGSRQIPPPGIPGNSQIVGSAAQWNDYPPRYSSNSQQPFPQQSGNSQPAYYQDSVPHNTVQAGATATQPDSNFERAATMMGMNAGPGGVFPLMYEQTAVQTAPTSRGDFHQVTPIPTRYPPGNMQQIPTNISPNAVQPAQGTLTSPGSHDSYFPSSTGYQNGVDQRDFRGTPPSANRRFDFPQATPLPANAGGARQWDQNPSGQPPVMQDRLGQFEAQRQRHAEEYNLLRQSLEAERQLPPSQQVVNPTTDFSPTTQYGQSPDSGWNR